MHYKKVVNFFKFQNLHLQASLGWTHDIWPLRRLSAKGGSASGGKNSIRSRRRLVPACGRQAHGLTQEILSGDFGIQRNKRLLVTNPQNGFTLTELLVSISLLGFVFIISINGFRAFDHANYVRSAQNRVSDAIRTAQSLALSGRSIENNTLTPLAFGVHIEKRNTPTGVDTVFVFADRCDKDGLGNWLPTALCCEKDATGACTPAPPKPNVKIGEDVSLTNGGNWPITLQEIKFGVGTTTNSVDIGFKRISATGFVDGKNGDGDHKKISMTFKNSKTNLKKVLTYDRISGRVDTEY